MGFPTPLNFPKVELKLYKQSGSVYVWDVFRQKRLLLTPEEWVRQHVLHYLINYKSVPKSLIVSEFSIEVNKLKRRCDGVVFNKEGKPILIIECKAPEVKLNEAVFYQIAQYNFKLKVQWLIVTNGVQTIVANVNQQTGEIAYLEEIPDYEEINFSIQ